MSLNFSVSGIMKNKCIFLINYLPSGMSSKTRIHQKRNEALTSKVFQAQWKAKLNSSIYTQRGGRKGGRGEGGRETHTTDRE